jgi:hypothetical protein
MFLAYLPSALGPVFAENLLRHYAMPDGSKPATMVLICGWGTKKVRAGDGGFFCNLPIT